MGVDVYLQNGKYTRVAPKSFLNRFSRRFGNRPHTKATIRLVVEAVRQHFSYRQYVTTTHDIRRSRFVPVRKILRMRLRTCGAVAATTAVVLRHLGCPTKLIHGKIRSRGRWVSHAWIEIYLPDQRRFVAVDPSRNAYRLTRWYRRLGEYRDWSEMKIGRGANHLREG